MQAVADAIRKAGDRAIVCPADVTSRDAVTAVRQRILAEIGVPRILINGAGGNHADAITATREFSPAELDDGDTRGFFQLDMDAFHRVLTANTMGTVIPSQVFGEVMARARRGVIINMGSMSGYRPLSKVGAYAMAKAGIDNFTQWLAAYLAPAGVRVNAIAPGFFVNERSRKLLFTPGGALSDQGAQVMHHTPMNAFGQAHQLLGTLHWLIDDDASGFVTGVMIPVDGGFLSSAGL